MHQKSLQILATGVHKAKQGISPEIISDLFHFIQKPYNHIDKVVDIKKTEQFSMVMKVAFP